MSVMLIAFNCLSLINPHIYQIADQMRGDTFIEKCQFQPTGSQELPYKMKITGYFKGEILNINYLFTPNCEFVATNEQRTVAENRLYMHIPQYFLNQPGWDKMCKTVWFEEQ